jgi:hypothetical protein
MTESDFLKSALGARLSEISFCNFKAYETEPTNEGYEKFFISCNLGCALCFDNGVSLLIAWTEDPYGDPYRIKVFNFDAIKEEMLLILNVSAEQPWNTFIGKELIDLEVWTYRSHYDRKGTTDYHEVDWGMEFFLGEKSLLVSALSSEHPFRKGTQEEILISENEDFINTQKERFEEFLGFYGTL